MAEPASLRDRNLVQWLENKLGAAEDLWNGRTAASLLTKEIIEELDSCFQDLQTHVKLRILIAIVHLSYRNLDLVEFFNFDFPFFRLIFLLFQWKDALANLLSLALKDADDWVQTIADLLKDYPSEGVISFPDDDFSHFSKTLVELRKLGEENS